MSKFQKTAAEVQEVYEGEYKNGRCDVFYSIWTRRQRGGGVSL